jgi:hypothetical protein
MRGKKANALVTTIIVVAIIVAVVISGVTLFTVLSDRQSGIEPGKTQTELIAEQTKSGDVAQIKVYARDLANDNQNTHVAATLYCVDDLGNFVIDGETGSSSARTTGSTTRGRKVSCYAADSTYQTLDENNVDNTEFDYWDREIDEEVELITIDAYTIAASSRMDLYTSTDNVVHRQHNITISTEGSDSYNTMEFENNDTDKWYPLAGFYADVYTTSNISDVYAEGTAIVKNNPDISSVTLYNKQLSTSVGSRKETWDYTIVVDADSSKDGDQVLILEQNDYIETGSLVVETTEGCSHADHNNVTMYSYIKGWYRTTR